MDLLAVLEALGDDTRCAIYRELSTSTRALTAPDLAERLGLHANTVRLHLERMRESGVIEVERVHRGTVGRPQHVYSLAPQAPGLALDPPRHALLAGLLGALAERAGADADDAVAAGQVWGVEAGRRARDRACATALVAELERLGFDPAPAGEDGLVDIAFMHCPFRDLAEAYPELVCNLHRGICEGLVAQVGGGTVEEFGTLYDHEPCRVTVAVRVP